MAVTHHNTNDVPRWARDAAVETSREPQAIWEEIQRLLHEGFDSPDVIRELRLPERVLRSLQVYARKFGPKRRLAAVGVLHDAMVKAAVENADQFVHALRSIASHAVSTEIDEGKQQRAFELMLKFAARLNEMMAVDQKEAAEARQAEVHVAEKKAELSADAIQQIRDIYGIRADGSA